MAAREPIVTAIDVGKSKVAIGVFDSELRSLDHRRIPVVSPRQAVTDVVATVRALEPAGSGARIGLSIFGPLVTDRGSADFGAIRGSSVPAWSGLNLPQLIASTFEVEVYFAYDVVAGAVAQSAELSFGASFTYLSVGTGIGGVHFRTGASDPGSDPPQLGHIGIPREADDFFPGSCIFHGDCLQGLASGQAISARWGVPARELSADHEAWDLEARYLARAGANILYTFPFAPIYVGAGISSVPGLLEQADRYAEEFLNGFPAPDLGARSCLGLMQRATRASNSSLYGAAELAQTRSGLFVDT